MPQVAARAPTGSSSPVARPPSIDLVVPSICFMEAFTVLVAEQKRHNRSINDIASQINQAQRNLASSRVDALTSHLRQAVVEFDLLFDEFKSRLIRAINTLGSSAELIHPSPEILSGGLASTFIDDPTDNLILASVLHHASRADRPDKAFLSENQRDFARDSIARAA